MKTLSRTVVFALVGALGFGWQLGVLHLLVGAGLAVGASTALAVLTAVAHNFLWHRRWTWRDRAMDAGAPHAQFLRFVGLNGLVSLAGNVAITAGLAASGVPVLAANAVAVVVCSLANYVLADRLVFAAASAVLLTAGAADAAVLEPRTLAGWQEYVKATEQRIARGGVEVCRSARRRPTSGGGCAPVRCCCRRARRGDPTARRSRCPTAPCITGWAACSCRAPTWIDSWPSFSRRPRVAGCLPKCVRSEWLGRRGVGCAFSCASSATASSMSPTTSSTRCGTRGMPAGHVTSRSASRRIVQLDDPGTPAERPLPEGDDSGFLWRLNAYWRYVPVDGGVLVECESLALSRSVPSLLRPVAAPIIDKVSRESLENTLRALRAGFARHEVRTTPSRPFRLSSRKRGSIALSVIFSAT